MTYNVFGGTLSLTQSIMYDVCTCIDGSVPSAVVVSKRSAPAS